MICGSQRVWQYRSVSKITWLTVYSVILATYVKDLVSNQHQMCCCLCVAACGGDGGKVGPAAFAGGGSRSRQSGAAQPAGGGEEVGGLTSPVACSWHGPSICLMCHCLKREVEVAFGGKLCVRPCLTEKWKICSSVWKRRASPKETWR